jgi:hypothetical protein
VSFGGFVNSGMIYNSSSVRWLALPDPLCKHNRTQLIAKDDDAQYVECLDCGEIFEVGELNDGTGSSESLSDA